MKNGGYWEMVDEMVDEMVNEMVVGSSSKTCVCSLAIKTLPITTSPLTISFLPPPLDDG